MTDPTTAVPERADATAVSKLPLLVMGSVIAMAALVTVVLIVARGPATYAEGTPQATLQAFTQAGLDEDVDTMLDLMTPDARARCRSEVQADNVRFGLNDDLRIVLEDTELDGTEANMRVAIKRSDAGDPFASSWSTTANFGLVDTASGWQVAYAEWPRGLRSCSRMPS